MVHNLKLAFEKISANYPALKLNRRGGTLTNKKEYFLKVLVAGGGELLKSQLLVLSTILCTVCLYAFKIKGPIAFYQTINPSFCRNIKTSAQNCIQLSGSSGSINE